MNATKRNRRTHPRGPAWRRWPLLALVLVLSSAPLRAADAAADFDQANKLYEEGKYAAAAQCYDKLIDLGMTSEALYFNRGNALFKSGQIGRAIASYRQAAQLAPRDPDVRANLQFARTQARGGASYRADLSQRYLEALTPNEWTLLATGAFWIFFGVLAYGQWRPELAKGLRSLCLVSALAAIVAGVSLAFALGNGYFTKTAIVVVGEADVRNGPLDESQTTFKVRDGAELNILDRKDDWLQVSDSSQRAGWLKQSQVLILAPSTRAKSGA